MEAGPSHAHADEMPVPPRPGPSSLSTEPSADGYINARVVQEHLARRRSEHATPTADPSNDRPGLPAGSKAVVMRPAELDAQRLRLPSENSLTGAQQAVVNRLTAETKRRFSDVAFVDPGFDM